MMRPHCAGYSEIGAEGSNHLTPYGGDANEFRCDCECDERRQ